MAAVAVGSASADVRLPRIFSDDMVLQCDQPVAVSAAAVTKTAAVRFAWKKDAVHNLVNTSGLPAYPFRTGP